MKEGISWSVLCGPVRSLVFVCLSLFIIPVRISVFCVYMCGWMASCSEWGNQRSQQRKRRACLCWLCVEWERVCVRLFVVLLLVWWWLLAMQWAATTNRPEFEKWRNQEIAPRDGVVDILECTFSNTLYVFSIFVYIHLWIHFFIFFFQFPALTGHARRSVSCLLLYVVSFVSMQLPYRTERYLPTNVNLNVHASVYLSFFLLSLTCLSISMFVNFSARRQT